MQNVSIKKFKIEDIANKVNWINDSKNNEYLHYEIPLSIEKTKKWFEVNEHNNIRYDAVIFVGDKPVGLIGLLDIRSRESAEYYVLIGEKMYKGQGVARKATKLLLDFAFNQINLQKVYAYCELENCASQKLMENTGFIRTGIVTEYAKNKYGKLVDGYIYEYRKAFNNIQLAKKDEYNNNIYFMREDLLGFSFGGNKYRKAILFFEEAIKQGATSIVTYGSASSNHARIIANLAKKHQMKCYIISPEEGSKKSINLELMKILDAEIIYSEINLVSKTIDQTIENLKNNNENVYFIAGGGHGNIGTKAYNWAFSEITNFEKLNNQKFSKIFLASGTGTTQAGLVCGSYILGTTHEIYGISIARKHNQGFNVVKDSCKDYLNFLGYSYLDGIISNKINFIDSYIFGGYGCKDMNVLSSNLDFFGETGISLDSTYTGKAYYAMQEIIVKNNIKNENILFVHTGGTPLFFEDLKELSK